jgi:hypothetical protein
MAIIKYNIPQLNKFFFGEDRFLRSLDEAVRLVPYTQTNVPPAKQELPKYGTIKMLEANSPSIASVMDTPIYERTTFELGEHTGVFYTLPNDPLIRTRLHKVIIKTQITKRQGTVKELITIGDYEVKISGFICNFLGKDYPQDDVDQFAAIFQVGAAMPVTNDMLNRLGVHNLVIEDIDLERFEAMPNIQPFEISALSDMPIELKYKADKALGK